jgi:hypothetical protein
MNVIDLTEPDIIDLTESDDLSESDKPVVGTKKRYVDGNKNRYRPLSSPKTRNIVRRKPFLASKTKRRFRPIKAMELIRFRLMEEKQNFVRLGQKYIQTNNLDSVAVTSHMESDQTTLFLIGEIHRPHTKCIEILEMFKSFIQENKELKNSFTIDIIIEQFQYYVDRRDGWGTYKQMSEGGYYKEQSQIVNVRGYLEECMTKRNCSVRVHWADPTLTKLYKIPHWLNRLGGLDEYGIVSDNGNKESDLLWWTKIKEVTDELKEEKDLSKLITENPIMMKEIRKASKVNPLFTLDFVLKQLKIVAETVRWRERISNWKLLVFYMNRASVDIYAIARIIKLKMKYVIFYGGSAHALNIETMLYDLKFKTIHHDDKTGACR